MLWAWISTLLQVNHVLVWKWCTIRGIFILSVVSVVTMIVVNANLGAHDKVHMYINITHY
jgi:hypothetical protein